MTIEVHNIIKFTEDVQHEMQQMKPRLLEFCNQRQLEGEKTAVDGMGPVELVEVTGRHQAINEVTPEHTRRRLLGRRYEASILVDESDVRKVLMNPTKEYSKLLTAAINRKIDRVIADAAFAAVLTGKNMDTSVTFATDGGQTVDATAGLTYVKLLEALKNFTNLEVTNEQDPNIAFAITGDEEYTMMNITQLTNGDYVRQFAVENGGIQRALGMKVIKFGADVDNPILSVASGTRDCLVLQKGGIDFGIAGNIEIVVEKLPERVKTFKVEAIIECGAVRRLGSMAQKFQTTTS